MVSERDRILKIVNYLESLGINVNISKNKARGHKGFFKCVNSNSFRIDISNNLSESEILKVLVHEFAHYVHYQHDKELLSLDFAFGTNYEYYEEELIKIAVKSVPKSFASAIYTKKESLNKEIKFLSDIIKIDYPNFKLSKPFMPIESKLLNPFKYFVKYDSIKIHDRIYSISSLNEQSENLSNVQIAYLNLKSKQRQISRINSRILKYNKYYSSPAELFARFCELYFLNKKTAFIIAPNLSNIFVTNMNASKIEQLRLLESLL